MFTDVRVLDPGTIIRAAAERRRVLTTHGDAILIRWATPKARNRARIQLGTDRFRTVPLEAIIAVELTDADAPAPHPLIVPTT